MSEHKFLKCLCAQCGGHIEFPADGIGMTIPCPHCGWETELTLAAPEEASARSARSLKWMIAGAVILLIGIVGGLGALFTARHLLMLREAQSETTQAPMRKTDRVVLATPMKESATIISGFSTSDVKLEKTPGSALVYAVGTVKNETDRQRFEVTVEIHLFDSAGRRVGASTDYKDTVEPQGEWGFRALLLPKAVVTARVGDIRERQ